MKNKIIKSTALLAILFSVFFLFSNSFAEKKKVAWEDTVHVTMNGVPVQGASVLICNNGTSGTTGKSGDFGFAISSGYYQVVVNYGTFGGSTYRTFTSGEDYIVINLVSGNVGCDNN